MALATKSLERSHGRLWLSGGWMVLVIAVVHGLATAVLKWQEGLTQLETLPPLMDRLLTFSQGGMIPALLLLACGLLLKRYPYRATRLTLGAMATVVIAALAVPVASTWTSTRYDESMREAFREWRALIPPTSNVMWTAEESLWGDGALNTWMLLERPSFISGTQAPNALFSRPAALEMRARSQQLWGRLPFVDPFRPKGSNVSSPPPSLQLATVCQASSVRYVVTQATMSDAIPVPAPASAPVFLRNYKLYICT